MGRLELAQKMIDINYAMLFTESLVSDSHSTRIIYDPYPSFPS